MNCEVFQTLMGQLFLTITGIHHWVLKLSPSLASDVFKLIVPWAAAQTLSTSYHSCFLPKAMWGKQPYSVLADIHTSAHSSQKDLIVTLELWLSILVGIQSLNCWPQGNVMVCNGWIWETSVFTSMCEYFTPSCALLNLCGLLSAIHHLLFSSLIPSCN